MLDNAVIQGLVEQAMQECQKALEKSTASYRRIYPPMDELCSWRTKYCTAIESDLKTELQRVCCESGIEWDQEEWKELQQMIIGACGLKLVPYQFHPYDLGFDRLEDGLLYVFRNRLSGLEEMYQDPSPGGKTFRMILRLEKDGALVPVDFTYECGSAEEGDENGKRCRKYDGYGRFPGYSGAASIHIYHDSDPLVSGMLMKCYARFSEPIWQRRKPTTETAYTYAVLDNSY